MYCQRNHAYHLEDKIFKEIQVIYCRWSTLLSLHKKFRLDFNSYVNIQLDLYTYIYYAFLCWTFDIRYLLQWMFKLQCIFQKANSTIYVFYLFLICAFLIFIVNDIKISNYQWNFTFPSFFLLIFLHVPYDPDPMVPMTSKSSNVLGILGLKQPKKGNVSFTKTKAKCSQ